MGSKAHLHPLGIHDPACKELCSQAANLVASFHGSGGSPMGASPADHTARECICKSPVPICGTPCPWQLW